MNGGTVARLGLVLGLVLSGVVLALWSDWDAAAITGFLSGVAGIGVALLVQLKATAEVHTMVNQQRSDMVAHTKVLEDALRAGGLSVPRDRSGS